MKFDFPNSKETIATASTGVGVVAGGMVSDGLTAVLPGSDKVKRGAMAVGGFALAAANKGKDALSNAVKGVCIGIAAASTIALVRDVMAPAVATTDGMNSAFLRGAMGMNSNVESFAFPQIRQVDPAFGFQPEAQETSKNPFEGMRVAG